MIGADEYADLFKIEQVGKLYLVPGNHARGKTFQIYVVPDGKRAPCEDMVEVYGAVSGQPGWTESYGWLFHGSWETDFYRLVEKRKRDLDKSRALEETARSEAEKEQQNRVRDLLAKY